MKVSLFLVATMVLVGAASANVDSPWGSGQSGRGLSKFNPSHGWYDEDAEDEEEVVGVLRGIRSGRSLTDCMFLGGQCPYNGKSCCQGRPPWSNQYKVACINGRCKKVAKCMFLGGQCPYNGKSCCRL
eukprot:g958.t1